MNNITYAFLLCSLAGLSTMLGCIVIFIKNKSNKILIASLAFAAGVMTTVSITDLIPESLHYLKTYLFSFPRIIVMLICICIGIILSMTIDKYLPENKANNSKLYRVGIISMLAIILHNIPEGIATFMTSSTNIKIGLSLSIAIALHNIPEGISISMPIYSSTKSKSKAILYTFISGFSEPIGSLIAYLFLFLLVLQEASVCPPLLFLLLIIQNYQKLSPILYGCYIYGLYSFFRSFNFKCYQ